MVPLDEKTIGVARINMNNARKYARIKSGFIPLGANFVAICILDYEISCAQVEMSVVL